MDRFGAMSVLLAVVEAGSLSGAGRTLNMPLATVSRRIADLEAHLGAQLLARSNRSIALTDAGQSFVASCRRILGDLAEAERAAAGEYASPKGELVLTAPIVFGRLHILPVVAEFLRTYPEIEIRLMLADRFLHLTDDHVDLALRIGDLPDSSLRSRRLGAVRRVVCASPAYLDSRGTPDSPEALAHHDCVVFEGLGTERWGFRQDGGEVSVPIRPRLAVNTAEAAIDAAVAGLGLTRVLSYQIEAAERAGQLVRILEYFAPAAIPVSLVFSGQGPLPLKLRAFLDFATPRLRATQALRAS